MTQLLSVMLAGLLTASSAFAGGRSEIGEKPQKGPKHQHTTVVRETDRSNVDVHIVFSSHDVRLIREYYAPRYRALPPGLQKKYARTGRLPPGWQKKMEPFPVSLERELVVLPEGYRRGVIDGHAVIYKPNSPVIIDVAVLF